MYEFLQKYFNQRWSTILAATWYMVLIILILYMSLAPEGELRYLNY